MKEYVLIFRLNIKDKTRQPGPEEMKTYMKAWTEWIHEISDHDQLADGGNHFSYTVAKVIRGSKVSDGPYLQQDEGIAGYIVILAKDIDSATAIALKCPILNGEGVVEVREAASPI